MTTAQFFKSAWEWNAWVVGFCAAGAVAYGVRRKFRFDSRTGWLAAGLALFFLTLASPVDTLADGYLFSAHMLQHLLLLLIIPPLILLSIPVGARPAKFRFLDWTARLPIVCWILGLGGMWLWHAPTLCNAAVATPWIHRVQYASLMGMGLAFWWPIIGPWEEQRLSPMTGIAYLVTACLGCTLLGIIITFSPVEVCSIYLHPQDRLGVLPLIQHEWALTPSRDQQLGGLLMWVPACIVYFTAILGMLNRWYAEGSADIAGKSRVRQNDRRGRARLLPSHTREDGSAGASPCRDSQLNQTNRGEAHGH